MSQTLPSNFLQRTQSARKIIVVDLGFLGDSVHLVPALWELQRNYPNAEVHTLSAVVGAEVLKLVPCVKKAWAFPLTPDSPPWWRHWDIIGALRKEKFDVAYNFSGADRTIFLTALIGAKHSVAHAAGREHFWNYWLIPNWVSRRTRELPVYQQKREVLDACGLGLHPARFDLQPPEQDKSWAANAVPANSIHVSINASASDKEWPLERWAALVKALLEKRPDLCVVATAGNKEREQQRLAELKNAVKHDHLIAIDTPSIGRFAALLQRCQLHIGADSGALHLAMAMGVPTLGIFRQYDGLDEWRPVGREHRSVVGPSLGAITVESLTNEALGMLQPA